MRFGFLGPETTFTHQALLQALRQPLVTQAMGGADPQLVPYPNVAGAVADLVAGDVDALMAPIENSVEGGVSGTLDVLAATGGITIVAEEIVPITFVLAAQQPIPLTDVRTVASHTHAQAQCQHWVRQNLPGAAPIPALSTAAAAREVSELDADSPDAAGAAALCSPLAAEHHGLHVLARGVEDTAGAQTRFVLVARDSRIPARTGADKTTIVARLRADRSGSLLELLEIVAANGVNLSRIESRPIGDALGRYSFSIDMEGHIEDRRVASCLKSLHRVCASLVFLGSYARADALQPRVDAAVTDDAFAAATRFVDELQLKVRPRTPKSA